MRVLPSLANRRSWPKAMPSSMIAADHRGSRQSHRLEQRRLARQALRRPFGKGQRAADLEAADARGRPAAAVDQRQEVAMRQHRHMLRRLSEARRQLRVQRRHAHQCGPGLGFAVLHHQAEELVGELLRGGAAGPACRATPAAAAAMPSARSSGNRWPAAIRSRHRTDRPCDWHAACRPASGARGGRAAGVHDHSFFASPHTCASIGAVRMFSVGLALMRRVYLPSAEAASCCDAVLTVVVVAPVEVVAGLELGAVEEPARVLGRLRRADARSSSPSARPEHLRRPRCPPESARRPRCG